MAQPQKPATNQKPNAPTPPPTKPSGDAGMSAAKAKTSTSAAAKKGEKLRFYSAVDEGYTFRILKEFVDKFGPPEHKGKPMVQRASTSGGDALKAAREEREKKLAAMTKEQQVEFLKAERESRKAVKESRKKDEYNKLVDKIQADIAAGRNPKI